MSLEQASHQEQESPILDRAKMIESIQDPEEREAARALLIPKKREKEKAPNKPQVQKEALQAAQDDQAERERLLSALGPVKPDQATTQPLTAAEQQELDQNLRQQKELIAKLETLPPQTRPTYIETTQALSPEEQALLKTKLREQETLQTSTTNQPRKKVSFWKRLFN